MTKSSYKGYRFPPEIIQQAIWLYLRFTLSLGKGGCSSHHAYSRPGERELLNFQNHNGRIPAYQARQLIVMIDKYEDEL